MTSWIWSLNFEILRWTVLRGTSAGIGGDLEPEDKELNDEALLNGDRLVSAYEYPKHEDWKIWIITEWDRSATTILFPHEY